MADAGGNFKVLQQQLADLQHQLDQQRAAQAPTTNAAAANAVNAVETLQLPAFWLLAPEAAPYNCLKEKLTNTYGKSKYQLCNELFDMSPSARRSPAS